MFDLNRPTEMIIGFLIGFIVGTTIHEFMHAYSAYRLGDDTAAREGRITLNPAAHFDPMGFIFGVLLAFGIGFIAWGKPVPVNPYALKWGRRGWALVAIAGPLSNLALAITLTPLYRFSAGALPEQFREVIYWMIIINVLLFAFNLIPIPPLDGYNILTGILPNPWVAVLEPLRRYSIPILLGLVFFLPYLASRVGFDLNPVRAALAPVINLIRGLLLG